MTSKPDQGRNLTEAALLKEAIFRIGKVTSVDGRKVKVIVDKAKNTSHLLYKGELLKNISVGGYVKILKGFTSIIGKVEGENVDEDRAASRKQYKSEKDKIKRILNISLLGFFQKHKFKRGIKELPLIDNECFLVESEEFNQIHNFVEDGDEPLCLGTLSLEKAKDISFGINRLLASHIGIFGNTGSGKSYTLAKLYHELFEKYKDQNGFKKNAQFFLLDFNGEYIDDDVIVAKKYKNIYELSTRKTKGRLPIPQSSIEDPVFWNIILEATEKTQRPFLKRAIRFKKFAENFDTSAHFVAILTSLVTHVVSQNNKFLEKGIIINLIKEVADCLEGKATGLSALAQDYQESLQWHAVQNCYFYSNATVAYWSNNTAHNFIQNVVENKFQQITVQTDQLTALEKIRLRIIFKYYDEIIRGYSNVEHLAPVIKRLDQRINDLDKIIVIVADVAEDAQVQVEKNFTVISLKDVSIEMKKVIPLLLCKNLYDEKKKQNDSEKYLNLIIDEAHNILSFTSERESETWKDYRLETFEEIVKEGRKFGVFLTLASQRPSDISSTIISQLHNYILHRLINNKDIEAVEKTISYLDKVSFEALPILATGTAIVAGQFAEIPVLVDIGKIPQEFEPRNKTMTLIDKWKDMQVAAEIAQRTPAAADEDPLF